MFSLPFWASLLLESVMKGNINFLRTIMTKFIKLYIRRYKVYKVTSKTEVENEYLKALQQNSEYDFWSKLNKVGHPVTIMASPKVQDEFEAYLTENNIPFNLEIENVEK